MSSLVRPLKSLLLLLFFMASCCQVPYAQVDKFSATENLKKADATRRIQQPGLNLTRMDAAVSKTGTAAAMFQEGISTSRTAQKGNAANCHDSSFLKIFESANRAYSFSCSAKTRDGGILIGGYGRNLLEGPPYIWSSVISKFDSIGNHIWLKEIKSGADPGFYIESMSEMSDGTIVLNGWYDNPLSTTPPTPNVDFFVAKLTATGNLLWLRTFHSLLGNNCTISNIRYTTITEGRNGDFFIAGTISNCPQPTYSIVLKLSSAGNVQWQYSFADPSLDSYCIGLFYDANYLTVVNRSSEPGGAIQVSLMRLDETTGAYISHKAWKPDLPYPASFYAGYIMWTPQAIRLNNGNYCIYGQTFGEYSITNTDMPHFSVLEFNSSYDFIKGYTINSSLMTNVYDGKIEVDRFGRVVYSVATFTDPVNRTKHIGAAANAVVVHERRKTFPNLEVFFDNLELFDDGSYVFINNLATPSQANFYLYYSLLHNTDTSSACLGLRDNFSHIVPIRYIPNNFTWAAISPNFLVETQNINNSVANLIYTASPPCFSKSFCDTLKIHGNAASCDIQQGFTFTAYKNQECGSRVSWFIDTSVVQQFQIINDTTVSLSLKQPWQGWLYAEISTSCGIAKDSLLLTVIASPGNVDLGPDINICPGNSIVLNAHNGYASYLWNNGTTDSLFAVTSPGKYYVDTRDACGNSFSDTVIVSPAPPIAFDIGPDRNKCNSDTLHLTATSGFLNYTWGPGYNISSQSSQNVVVQPATDTIYFAMAEKSEGCFAYDTIRIKVNHSPPINLGGDVSFCSGDSVVLDAGPGFAQYQWDNGTFLQLASAYSTGMHSVIGTTAEGCRSYDTLKVLNIWSTPVVNLNDNPELCIGSARVLQPGNYSSYLWQDGTTSASFVAKDTGTYHVIVADDHQCAGADTIHITTLLSPPANFLPGDTTICTYGSLQITPTANYTNYLWSNNATSPVINITSPGLLWLQVTDAKSCQGRDSILISLKECIQGFHIPSAFTPDNDGLNDIFRPIIGGTVKHYQFTIYNRWGKAVFTTNELYKGWDGTLGGVAQDSNVFAWTCTYQLDGQNKKQEKGTVVLIR